MVVHRSLNHPSKPPYTHFFFDSDDSHPLTPKFRVRISATLSLELFSVVVNRGIGGANLVVALALIEFVVGGRWREKGIRKEVPHVGWEISQCSSGAHS
jgi:hypothetical protein